jgi:hypothetical protein
VRQEGEHLGYFTSPVGCRGIYRLIHNMLFACLLAFLCLRYSGPDNSFWSWLLVVVR